MRSKEKRGDELRFQMANCMNEYWQYQIIVPIGVSLFESACVRLFSRKNREGEIESDGLLHLLPNPLIAWCHYFVILLQCNNQESIEQMAYSHAFVPWPIE